MTRSHPASQRNRRWLLSCFVRVAICAILAGLVTSQASGQQVSLHSAPERAHPVRP